MFKRFLSIVLALYLFVTPSFALISDYSSGVFYASAQVDRVLVRKDGEQYSYPGTDQALPLLLGNGEYQILYLQDLGGNRYKPLKNETIVANNIDQNQLFVSSTYEISWNENMEAIKFANSLVGNEQQKIQQITSWIIDHVEYDFGLASTVQSGYIPNVDKIFQTKTGICYDYSVLAAAMLRSIDIPTKVVKGYSQLVDGYHAWNEVLIDGEWKIIDLTVDAANSNSLIFYESKIVQAVSKI